LSTTAAWIESYKPCLEPIRAALSAPSDQEKQETAFSALVPNVIKIKEFSDTANGIAAFLPKLLAAVSAPMALAEEPDLTYKCIMLMNAMYESARAKRAQARGWIGAVLPLTLPSPPRLHSCRYQIDQKKMMCPGIQNDFSFYRRSVGKFPVSPPSARASAKELADANDRRQRPTATANTHTPTTTFSCASVHVNDLLPLRPLRSCGARTTSFPRVK
jgi:hypothetical protein